MPLELVWKDRVWPRFVMLFTGWPQDGTQLLVFYAQGMSVGVAAVSMFLPAIQGRDAAENPLELPSLPRP